MAAVVAPVPRIALPNPHLRKPSLSSTIAQADSVRNSGMGDIPVPVPAIPKEHQHSRSISDEIAIGQAVTSYSPIDGTKQCSSPSSAAQKYAPKHKTSSPQSKSNDSGYASGGSASAKSPVVPIRSMFPVYNPQMTLAQQHYYPQRPMPARTNSVASSRYDRPEYPPSTTAWTPIDRALGPPSAPATIANFPLDTLTPHLSTQKELADLWEATHGMEPHPKIRSYDLELAR